MEGYGDVNTQPSRQVEAVRESFSTSKFRLLLAGCGLIGLETVVIEVAQLPL